MVMFQDVTVIFQNQTNIYLYIYVNLLLLTIYYVFTLLKKKSKCSAIKMCIYQYSQLSYLTIIAMSI